MPRRLCKGCNEYTIPKDAEKNQKWCSDACFEIVVQKAYERGRAMAERSRQKKIRREMLEQSQEQRQRKRDFLAKDFSYQFELTRKAAQKLANRLDAGLSCICCTRPRKPGVVFCGGHFRTGAAHRELALDLLNIHGQENTNCNMHLSGNISGDKNSKGFKQGLIDRYGQWIVVYLESYHPPKNYTCEDLIALRAVFNAEIRRLEAGLPPSRNWRARPAITGEESGQRQSFIDTRTGCAGSEERNDSAAAQVCG